MLFAFLSTPNNNMRMWPKNEHHRTHMILLHKTNRNGFQGEDPIFYSTEK